MALVQQFLAQIRQQVQDQRGDLLRAWLQVEPNAPQQYHAMAAELRSQVTGPDLDQLVERALPQDDDVAEGEATAWPSLQTFIRDYLVLWRDIDHDDVLQSHELLTTVVNSCGTAFTHPQYGAMLLDLCMLLCESLVRFTLRLHRQPGLTRHLRARDEDGASKSIAESSAEIIQKFFKTCLMDRAAGHRPEGKKVGVYMFANLVLKLLFACKKTNLASMIFRNMSASSPPLRLYPASQRVTYLYYLGRFNFATSHYLRAALCLQQAYLHTPSQLVSHRANILTYLVPSNMLLGRFPSTQLARRPEAQALMPILMPLCDAVRAGDFVRFQDHLAAHDAWLLEKGLYLQLCFRLRPLLWRSLARRTFLLTYIAPNDEDSRRAATLDLAHLLTTARFLQRRIEGWIPASQLVRDRPFPHHVNSLYLKAVTGNVHQPRDTSLLPPPGGARSLAPYQGLVCGNRDITLQDIEMTIAGLIRQELMHGFVAHGQARFAIIGAKAKGPVLAGWPSPWQAIVERRYDDNFDPNHVPGWVRG
ncbi:hypothetical protein CDD82_1407 [Ophiocordyceps australis]|uniref:PCI domain-containing protein n=1 Tax=Ophiocordyceps australis TaxID=1399860 RepID=A0A2C5YSB7_9HYPO|nr:hypothetical protein CDD82_1407 [Ophiocordyceps australis]